MLALVQWSITTLAAPVRFSGFNRVSCQGQLKPSLQPSRSSRLGPVLGVAYLRRDGVQGLGV